jgi:uncharacterized protein
MFPVEIDSTIGFIDDLAYEDLLELGMEASWVEEGMINPLEIIEDELILAVPDAPFDEAQSHVDETKTSEDEDLKAHKPNPFSVLENLK